jgi:FMN phosphatase YigB (HAD superfamily)
MSLTKFYTLERLLARGRALAAKSSETVSFDLFDTLLIRRVHDPDLLKAPVARLIAEKAAARGIKLSWQWVQKRRDAIEARHRAEAGRDFPDHEACYPRFMGELLNEIFGDAALLPEITAYELLMENQMLVPRAALVDWLRELADGGRKIFVISDVYLPSEHLKTLIAHAGFADCVEAVISSADTCLAKASGAAWPMLAKKFHLRPERWLHIGDNPISDGLRPSEFGIEALVLRDQVEKFRKGIVRRYWNYGQGRPFWRGRALQQMMLPLEAENCPHPPLFNEGYNFFAPLIGGFLQQVAERCRELGIRRIFFLSREGFLFQRFWQNMRPALYPNGVAPEAKYLYVSRMALAGAACGREGLKRSNLDIAFLPVGNRDFRDVCRIFSLRIAPLTPHLARHGLTPESCLSPKHDGYLPEHQINLSELLDDDDFQEEVRRQSAAANLALNRYLDEMGFFADRRVALVDIGWLGTIQRYLYDAVRHRPDCPSCFGFLFGATRGVEYPTTPENQIEGVIYDRHRFDMAASSVLYARDVFEEACRAPHPTLQAYELDGAGYRLRFRRTDDAVGQAELAQDAYFAPLQAGILAAAPRFAAASAVLGYGLNDYRPWFHLLLVGKLAFATTAEIAALRQKSHLDDFHGAHQPKKQTDAPGGLWDCSLNRLRFSPLWRLRQFFTHRRDRIKE